MTELSQHLLQQLSSVDMVVLDFDRTITARHTGGSQLEEWLTPDNILSNVYNVEHFRQFIQTLQQRGIKVTIATFAHKAQGRVGGKELVLRYLDAILGPGRTVLTGRHDIAAWYPKDGLSKNGHLKWLLRHHPVPRERVLLIDDDTMILARARFFGVLTAKVLNGLESVLFY